MKKQAIIFTNFKLNVTQKEIQIQTLRAKCIIQLLD